MQLNKTKFINRNKQKYEIEHFHIKIVQNDFLLLRCSEPAFHAFSYSIEYT